MNRWIAPLRGVVAVIEQYVTQRPVHLEWRAQRPQVVATVEDLATALKETVHQLADPRADAFHPARDRPVVLSLDQEMHVIALDRVVHDPEAVPDTGLAERRTEPSHEPG